MTSWQWHSVAHPDGKLGKSIKNIQKPYIIILDHIRSMEISENSMEISKGCVLAAVLGNQRSANGVLTHSRPGTRATYAHCSDLQHLRRCSAVHGTSWNIMEHGIIIIQHPILQFNDDLI